jgi:hypothetical protein
VPTGLRAAYSRVESMRTRGGRASEGSGVGGGSSLSLRQAALACRLHIPPPRGEHSQAAFPRCILSNEALHRATRVGPSCATHQARTFATSVRGEPLLPMLYLRSRHTRRSDEYTILPTLPAAG